MPESDPFVTLVAWLSVDVRAGRKTSEGHSLGAMSATVCLLHSPTRANVPGPLGVLGEHPEIRN